MDYLNIAWIHPILVKIFSQNTKIHWKQSPFIHSVISNSRHFTGSWRRSRVGRLRHQSGNGRLQLFFVHGCAISDVACCTNDVAAVDLGVRIKVQGCHVFLKHYGILQQWWHNSNHCQFGVRKCICNRFVTLKKKRHYKFNMRNNDLHEPEQLKLETQLQRCIVVALSSPRSKIAPYCNIPAMPQIRWEKVQRSFG